MHNSCLLRLNLVNLHLIYHLLYHLTHLLYLQFNLLLQQTQMMFERSAQTKRKKNKKLPDLSEESKAINSLLDHQMLYTQNQKFQQWSPSPILPRNKKIENFMNKPSRKNQYEHVSTNLDRHYCKQRDLSLEKDPWSLQAINKTQMGYLSNQKINRFKKASSQFKRLYPLTQDVKQTASHNRVLWKGQQECNINHIGIHIQQKQQQPQISFCNANGYQLGVRQIMSILRSRQSKKSRQLQYKTGNPQQKPRDPEQQSQKFVIKNSRYPMSISTNKFRPKELERPYINFWMTRMQEKKKKNSQKLERKIINGFSSAINNKNLKLI